MPHHTPGSAVALLLLVQTMFAMVFPCTLLGGVVPTSRWIPTKRLSWFVPVVVHAVPPAPGALPPMKFPVIVKLLPEVLLP